MAGIHISREKREILRHVVALVSFHRRRLGTAFLIIYTNRRMKPARRMQSFVSLETENTGPAALTKKRETMIT
jgi:hypothetical protein